jgi:hypothetical protein
MKIDDLIKEFEEKSKDAISEHRDKWENDQEADNIYDVDIHIWRKPGMGNSLQTISGNKLSIMTATSSYLQTLLDKDILNEEELMYMIAMVIRFHKKGK